MTKMLKSAGLCDCFSERILNLSYIEIKGKLCFTSNRYTKGHSFQGLQKIKIFFLSVHFCFITCGKRIWWKEAIFPV